MEKSQTTIGEVDAKSEQGLEILKHAFSGGKKVLEFNREDDDMTVADITEHHEILQEHYNSCPQQQNE